MGSGLRFATVAVLFLFGAVMTATGAEVRQRMAHLVKIIDDADSV